MPNNKGNITNKGKSGQTVSMSLSGIEVVICSVPNPKLPRGPNKASRRERSRASCKGTSWGLFCAVIKRKDGRIIRVTKGARLEAEKTWLQKAAVSAYAERVGCIVYRLT